MDQETMKFMEELKEFVHKAQKFLQANGGNFGQRNFYGMRDNGNNGGGGYGNQGGGGYGQRDQSWMHGPQNFPSQDGGNWGNNGPWDPRIFL